MDEQALALERQKRAKRRVQQKAYQLVHMMMIVYACLATAVTVFAAISFQTWVTLVFLGALGGAVAALIISMLDDVYAYTIVFIALVADTGWNVYVLVVDGPVFYKILYAVFNPGYIPDNCPQPYCQGYRADTFYFFYLLLAGETGLVLCMLYVYYQLVTIEANVSQSQMPEMYPYMLQYLGQEKAANARVAAQRSGREVPFKRE